MLWWRSILGMESENILDGSVQLPGRLLVGQSSIRTETNAGDVNLNACMPQRLSSRLRMLLIRLMLERGRPRALATVCTSAEWAVRIAQ